MHSTLRRPLSSVGMNTTLEDDVFYEEHLEAPNSAKPLLNDTRQFYLHKFPHLSMAGKSLIKSTCHPLNYFSKLVYLAAFTFSIFS